MRLIIPGASGFLGSNLLSCFSEKELDLFSEIILIDILQYEIQRIPHRILSRKNVSFVNGSIYDKNILKQYIKKGDTILHLAVEENTFQNPQKSGTKDILNYLNYLAKKNIRRFIFISTADIYGINNSSDIKEIDPVKPTIIYAANKASIEAYLQAYGHLYEFPFVVFRPVTIFGKYQEPGWLIPRTIQRVISGKNIQITGTGNARRDWISVDDVSSLLIKAIFYGNTDIHGEIFNIGTGREYSVLQVVKYIIKNTERTDINIEYIPVRAGDIPRQITTATKAKKTFGWQPEKEFFSELKNIISWYQSN